MAKIIHFQYYIVFLCFFWKTAGISFLIDDLFIENCDERVKIVLFGEQKY